jgi:hypothetical protein
MKKLLAFAAMAVTVVLTPTYSYAFCERIPNPQCASGFCRQRYIVHCWKQPTRIPRGTPRIPVTPQTGPYAPPVHGPRGHH